MANEQYVEEQESEYATLDHSFSIECLPPLVHALCSQVGLLQAEEQAGFVRYMCMEMAEDIGAGESADARPGEGAGSRQAKRTRCGSP